MKKIRKGEGVKNERKRQKERRGEGETVCGRESKHVAEDVLAWLVQNKTRQGTTQGKHENESRKSCQTEIFVKVDGSKAFPLDVSLSDKFGDIVERIPNSACSKRDVYVICERRVIRSDDLWSTRVSDGSIVHVSSRRSS